MAVPFAAAEQGWEMLRGASASVEMKQYRRMGHTISTGRLRTRRNLESIVGKESAELRWGARRFLTDGETTGQIELTTARLRLECSTPELSGDMRVCTMPWRGFDRDALRTTPQDSVSTSFTTRRTRQT